MEHARDIYRVHLSGTFFHLRNTEHLRSTPERPKGRTEKQNHHFCRPWGRSSNKSNTMGRTIMDADASNAGSALFSACVEEHGDVIQAVMLCVTQGLEATQESKDFEYKNWLLLLCSFNIFYMQVRAVINRFGVTS